MATKKKEPSFYRRDPVLFDDADRAICQALDRMHKCAPFGGSNRKAEAEHRAHINNLVDIRSYLLTLARLQTTKTSKE